MEIYPILNKPGKGKYVFIFILNERAVGGMRTYIARTTGNQNCFSTIHRSLPPLLRILFYVRRH